MTAPSEINMPRASDVRAIIEKAILTLPDNERLIVAEAMFDAQRMWALFEAVLTSRESPEVVFLARQELDQIVAKYRG